MHSTKLYIEFIGGPFDGHTRIIDGELLACDPILTVPTNVQHSAVECAVDVTHARGLAFYELEQRGVDWYYLYWGTKRNSNYSPPREPWLARAFQHMGDIPLFVRRIFSRRLPKSSASFVASLGSSERNSKCQ